MTSSDLQTRLNELETKAAEQRRAEREGIELARTINAKNRILQAEIRAIETQANDVRQQLKAALAAEDAAKAAESPKE